MKTIKHITAIISAKLIANGLRLLNCGEGTSLPGKIARTISNDILSYLVNQTKKEIIVVTGTNGKTTTSGFIASILNNDGRKIAHNRKGANMLNGITAAVISQSSVFSQLNVDNSLLEMDEAFFFKAVDEFSPDLVLVTNLFRDQLDRYGELNTTAKKIQGAINKSIKNKPLKVLLNADDPMVASLDCDNKVEKIYYGFDNVVLINQDTNISTPHEASTCKCGERYSYSKVFYGQLGHYECSCGYKRPNAQISANVEIDVHCSTLNIKYKEHTFDVKINMPGLYNAYNALAAIALSLEMDIKPEIIKNGLENYSTIFGRAENTLLNGKNSIIQLIKNPIGATEVLRTVKDDKNGRLLIIINDDYADGRDVSWLWDANFELLSNHCKKIIVSGRRASDMAVRLKYAGINLENIIINEDIQKALDEALNSTTKDEILYIMPTYTALLKLQPILKHYR